VVFISFQCPRPRITKDIIIRQPSILPTRVSASIRTTAIPSSSKVLLKEIPQPFHAIQYFTTVTAIKPSLKTKLTLQSCKLYRICSFPRHHGDDHWLSSHLDIGMVSCLSSSHHKAEGFCLPQAEQTLLQQPLLIPVTSPPQEFS